MVLPETHSGLKATRYSRVPAPARSARISCTSQRQLSLELVSLEAGDVVGDADGDADADDADMAAARLL